MAVAAAERARCALCGKWLRPRPAWDGQSYSDDERAYTSEFEEHECEGASAQLQPAGPEQRQRCKLTVDSLDSEGGSVPRRKLDLVDLSEIAFRLGVNDQTARQWRVRKVLPPAAAELRIGPVWEWRIIQEWARTRPSLADRLPNSAPPVSS